MKHFQSLSESAKHWLSVAERLLTMCLPSLLAYWVLGLLTALAVLLAVIIMASYFWTRLPRRFDANGWIPLHEAYRYLVYDTQWADNQLAGFCRGAFDNLVSAEMHERLARSEILSRGKFGGSQVVSQFEN